MVRVCAPLVDVRPNCVCGLPTHILGWCHFRRFQAWHETSRSMRGTAQRPQVGGRANLFWGDHLSISEFGVSPTNELFRFAPGCHGGGDKSDKTWMPRLFNASTLALIRHLNIFHYITSVGDTICWEGEALTHNNEPMRSCPGSQTPVLGRRAFLGRRGTPPIRFWRALRTPRTALSL